MQGHDFICITCKRSILRRKESYWCFHCRKSYPVIQGIPIFFKEELLTDHIQQQTQYFTQETNAYPKSYALLAWQKKYIERMFEYIHVTKNTIAVDDGCGSGYVTLELAKKGATVYACDINVAGLKRIIKMAKELGVDQNVIPVCCLAERLPLPNNFVSFVVINSVLEHLPKDRDAALEISRITKARANLMVTVPISYRFVSPILLPLHVLYDKKLGHLRRYTANTLSKLFPSWKSIGVYYSGYLKKAFKTIVNNFIHLYDEDSIEIQDSIGNNQPNGSTNMTVFLVKK